MGRKSSKLLMGMDVHKDSIDIARAEEGGELRHQGQVRGDAAALSQAVRKLERQSARQAVRRDGLTRDDPAVRETRLIHHALGHDRQASHNP